MKIIDERSRSAFRASIDLVVNNEEVRVLINEVGLTFFPRADACTPACGGSTPRGAGLRALWARCLHGRSP